jgi:flagellin-like protein
MMIKKNIFKSKNAISPILATLLLIVIAVAAIVVTYAWITTYIGSTTGQAGVLPYKANVNFIDDGVKKITIDIGNSGTSNTQIVGAYVGTSESTTQRVTTSPATPIALSAGSIVSFDVTYTWTAGETYYIRVVPEVGQLTLTFQEQAPQ